MFEGKTRTIRLDESHVALMHLSPNRKRLFVLFDRDDEGLTKMDVNLLIEELRAIRDEMER